MYAKGLCAECGERHSVGGLVPWPTDPSESGSLAELYPDGNMPGNIAYLLSIEFWCPQAKAHIAIEDPVRVFVEPVMRDEG